MAKKKDAVDIAAQQRAQEQAEVEQAFLTGINTLRDLIAPSSLEFELFSTWHKIWSDDLRLWLSSPTLHRLGFSNFERRRSFRCFNVYLSGRNRNRDEKPSPKSNSARSRPCN